MSNWWANKLANQGQPAPTYVPAQPQQQTYYQPVPQPQVQHPSKLPPSARVDDHCPNCDSGNYMAAPGSNYHRCLDCGYPLVQAGSGVGGVHSDTPTKKAKQVPTDGYHPTQIIGRVE